MTPAIGAVSGSRYGRVRRARHMLWLMRRGLWVTMGSSLILLLLLLRSTLSHSIREIWTRKILPLWNGMRILRGPYCRIGILSRRWEIRIFLSRSGVRRTTIGEGHGPLKMSMELLSRLGRELRLWLIRAGLLSRRV